MRIDLGLQMLEISLINQNFLFQFPGNKSVYALGHIIKVLIQIGEHSVFLRYRNPIRKVGLLNLCKGIYQQHFQRPEHSSVKEGESQQYGQDNNSGKQQNAGYHFILD